MSDNFNQINSTMIGHRGEEIIEFSLPLGHECWRYNKGGRCDLAKYRVSTLSTIERGKADADIIIGFRCCDKDGNRCPYLHDGDEVEAVALHEVKTNPSAVDEGISNRKGEKASSHTQNLYIEMVQSEGAYVAAIRAKAKTEANGREWEYRGRQKVYPWNLITEGCILEEDPLVEYGVKGENCKEIKDKEGNMNYYFEYIEGDGWWNKRKLACDRGQVKNAHAEWYHFYQPYDSWEWIGKKRKRFDKGYKEATEREIQAFMNDDGIPDGSILLLQYPVELCISISGAHLELIIDKHIDDAVKQQICIPLKSKSYADDGAALYTRKDEKPLVTAYLMPIKSLVPCREVYRHTTIPIKEFQDIEAAIWGERTKPDEANMTIIREKAMDANGEEIKGIAQEREEIIKLKDEKLSRGENIDAERKKIEELTKKWDKLQKQIEPHTKGLRGIRTTIIGKYIVKGTLGTPIKAKGAIPDGVKDIYVPQRIMGKAVKGGMLLYPLKPFILQSRYNPRNEKYVPDVIEQFACHVRPYKPPRKQK